MGSIRLPTISKVQATVQVPGSKSISNRALLISALADNYTILSNLLVSDDILWMLRALVSLGIKIYDLNSSILSFAQLESKLLTINDKYELEQVLTTTNCSELTLETITSLQNALSHNLKFSDEIILAQLSSKVEENSIPVSLNLLVKGNQGLITVDEDITLYLGNAGTAFRPLIASLAFNRGKGKIYITGDQRMYERPIQPLVTALTNLGARIEFMNKVGFAPLVIHPYNSYDQNTYNNDLDKGNFNSSKKAYNFRVNLWDNVSCEQITNSTHGNSSLEQTELITSLPQVEIDCQNSSQYLTSLLLVAPLLPQGLNIKVKNQLLSKPYIVLTLKMMEAFGVKVSFYDYSRFLIKSQAYSSNSQSYSSSSKQSVTTHYSSNATIYNNSKESTTEQHLITSYQVESDASSASYFFLAGMLAGHVTVENIDLNVNQGDIKLLNILESLGAKVEDSHNTITVHSNLELLQATGYKVKNFNLDVGDIPDAAMGLAVLSLFTNHQNANQLTNIASWKVKETDRILAIATELTKLGAKVSYTDNTIIIYAPEQLPENITIDTYNDHRIAMCFALASLNTQNIQITINNPECVNKTFPSFFKVFAQMLNN